MTRRVFFSFHYDDVMRVQQIRQMGAFAGKEVVRFDDAAAYEKVKKHGDAAIKHWIRKQLNGTSVTVVLIGTNTWQRPYVRYEIEQSYLAGNGLLGIHINGLLDVNQYRQPRGANPFASVRKPLNLSGGLGQPFMQSRQGLESFMIQRPPGMFGQIRTTLEHKAKIYPAGLSSNDYAIIKANIGNWIETAAQDVGR